MSTVISISTRRRYGVARVCRIWGIARAGVYRRRCVTETPNAPRRRPGPQGPMADAALVEAIRHALIDSPFHGEGYRKVWARLRHAGLRTSKERVRRLMRENGLSATTRMGRPRGPRNHDGTIITETIDTMWGTDMTAAFTVEHGQVAVFIAVDHCSAECVGIQRAQQRGAPSAKRTLSGDSGGPPSTAPATRHSSQSDRASPNASAASRRMQPRASASATITAANTCPATSRRRSPGSAPRPLRPSSGPPKATAAPNASSGR